VANNIEELKLKNNQMQE